MKTYMADEREILESQRAAVREHMEKYRKYKDSAPEAVSMTLRTIRNCQAQIEKIRGRHPHWPSSWEDTWTP